MDEEKKENPRETSIKNDNNKSLAMTTPSSQSLPLLMVSAFLCRSLSVVRELIEKTSHYPLHAPTTTWSCVEGHHFLCLCFLLILTLRYVRLVDIKFFYNSATPNSHMYMEIYISQSAHRIRKFTCEFSSTELRNYSLLNTFTSAHNRPIHILITFQGLWKINNIDGCWR